MANNVNNGITGVIDIPGALRSRGAADGNLVGGVVAYAGDIYDVTLDKNLAEVNSGFTEAIDDINDNISSIQDDISPLTGSFSLQLLAEYDNLQVYEGGRGKHNEVYIDDKDLAMNFGYNNTISNTRKLAFGFGQQLDVPDSTFVIGQRNSYEPNAAFIVGNGTLNGSTNNAFVIGRDGNFWVCGINGYTGQLTGASQYNSVNHFITGLDTRLTALEGITSSSSSAPTYSAGTGISISNNTISVNTSSLNYNDLSNIPLLKTAENGFKIVAHNSNSYNTASGLNAFAEGSGTYAAGVASHSEGSDTYAAAANSHVEGNGKVVIMLKQAYTQGDLTIVTDVPYPADTELESPRTQERVSVLSVQESQGVYICTLTQAFSEDIATNQPLNVYGGAIGVNSHAEGCGTIAAHDSTHAEGYGTIANGIYAKASGEKSYALGRASETTGRGTQALNEAEHASGRYNKSTSNVTQFSVGVGLDAEHRANAYEVTTDGKMYVKGVGGYDGTNVSDSSVNDLATAISQAGGVTDYDDLENKPIFQKEGERGYVLGNSNSATGLYSSAQGNGTYAIGDCSHAEGAAECVNNSLSSDYTAGSQTMNLKYIAYVGNIIIVDNQIAKILSVTKNSFDYTVYLDKPFASDISESTTIKIYPCAYGTYSHTEGFNSMASGESSHAEGYNTKAQGTASHAEGSGTKALGLESHAEGYDTYADGNYSHAEGADTQASGTYSHAEGSSSRATGESSHAEGASTYASGTRSHAEGYYSQAIGDYTHAEGFHTLARNTGEHACGTYNKSTQDVTLFSIGNGHVGQQGAPDIHQNAFEVDVNGNVYINNIGNYNGRNIGQSGVESVQQVIAELTLQIAALTNNL